MIDYTFSIKLIKKYLSEGKIDWTKHCLNRINQRRIKIEDIVCAINHGKIIEEYVNDYPYPSCLILGKNSKGKEIHILCGIGIGKLYMITAYYPQINKWKNDFETRRKR